MPKQPTVSTDSVAQDQIRAFVERVERLHEERTAIGKDISEVFAEAKGNGFDIKALKIVIAKRRQDHNERMELEALVELYEAALGMRGTYDDEGREVGTPRATRAPAPATTSLHNPKTTQSAAADQDGESAAALSVLPVDTESTAARTDVPGARHNEGTVDSATLASDRGAAPLSSPPAGTQAPPVDTIPIRQDEPVDAAVDGPQTVDGRRNSEPDQGEAGANPVTASEPAATGTAHNPIPVAVPTNVTTFTRKPHDGPVSSKGLARHKLCLHVDLCGGTWREPCFDCRKAAADAQGLTA